MGFFNKKNKESFNIHCIVLGEDKNLMHRNLESTGTFLLDAKNLLGYDSFPQCMGNFIRFRRGKLKFQGLTTLLYENMARPFSLSTLTWAKVEHKKDQIKEGAISEGCSKAVQRLDLLDRFDKMSTILLIAVAGVIFLGLLYALQTGLFEKIFGR